jgi:hypothetical protein
MVISTKARHTMMPLDTLDALGNVLFSLDAEDLPEPSVLAEAFTRLRRPEALTLQPDVLAEVAAAIAQAARCWQHGFIAGEVAYADACEEPRWPTEAIITAWIERDQRSYSADLFAQRWYRAGWLAGWGER